MAVTLTRPKSHEYLTFTQLTSSRKSEKMASFKELLKDVSQKRNDQLETLKAIRALVAANSSDELLSDVKSELLLTISALAVNSENCELSRRISWQIIYNCCVVNPSFTDEVMSTLKSDIMRQIQVEGPKTQNVLCAIVYLHLKSASEHGPEFVKLDFVELLIAIIGCDFALLIVHEMLKKGQILDTFEELSDEHKRIVLLEVIESIELEDAHEPLLAKLAAMFKQRSSHLLTNLFERESSISPAETSKLLQILGQASSQDNLRPLLQQDMSLLVDSLYLLRLMHDSTKKTRSKGQQFPEEPLSNDNPYYGFKCNLIRLIGNLCFRHKINQDQVRDCCGIQLILDCSPLDADNPMITQWVVLAIRNLCEDNAENKELIGNLDKKGAMDRDVLKSIGIDIH